MPAEAIASSSPVAASPLPPTENDNDDDRRKQAAAATVAGCLSKVVQDDLKHIPPGKLPAANASCVIVYDDRGDAENARAQFSFYTLKTDGTYMYSLCKQKFENGPRFSFLCCAEQTIRVRK